MSEFNPGPNETLMIGGYVYTVKPHPSVPAFAFGQEGRKAFVYQVGGGPDGQLYALKKFKPVYRVDGLTEVNDSLARFAQWRGLEVCARQCLQYGAHDDALNVYPDLEYAVLMPWISGSTWYDIVISETPLTRLEAITFANATAQVLAALEEAGLAHCDIAAPNIIINANTGRAHLIDVEDLYSPGFASPSALPAGTEGYAHLTAHEGLWKASGDRFAGAVLMAEMAGWHDPRIRKQSDEEHYFGGNEMQQDCPHYQLMFGVLSELHPALGDLFEAAWFSPTLEDCPTLKAWGEVLNEVYHRESLAKVVSGWQPIGVPGVVPAEQESRPISAPPVREQTDVPAAPKVKPQEESAVKVPMQPPAASPAPAKPSAPPASQPKPAIQPGHHVGTTGGPVIEWTPLIVPSQPPASPAAPTNGQMSGNRPIMMPPTQSVPEDVVEQTAPTARIETPQIDVSKEDTQENHWRGQIDDIIQAEQVKTYSSAVGGLLKPVLDLSHVDKRNRPFLVWSEVPGATGYRLQEADNAEFDGSKESKTKADETKWHPAWGRSGRLFYRVQALHDRDEGPWSDVLSIRIG
jgi:hypothetical protein